MIINICNDASGAQCCEIHLNKFGQNFGAYQLENYSGKYLKECQDFAVTDNIPFITMRCQGNGSGTGCVPGWVGEHVKLTLSNEHELKCANVAAQKLTEVQPLKWECVSVESGDYVLTLDKYNEFVRHWTQKGTGITGI